VNRGLSFVIAALQALIISATVLGLVLAPLTLAWFIEGDGSVDYAVVLQVAGYAFLLACGVPITFAAGEIIDIPFPEFVISTMPLGMTLLIALLAIRIGHRLSAASSLWPAWLAGSATFGGIGFLVSWLIRGDAVSVGEFEPLFIPALFFGLLIFIASVSGRRYELFSGANGPEAKERIAIRALLLALYEKLHWSIRTVLSPAARVGIVVMAAMILVSALAMALALGFGWIEVVRLYEAMRVSILGGVVLTIGQLAILPNLLIYGMAWLSGAGFAIGAGSSVTPFATQLGPMPAFPIFTAIPTGGLERGVLFVLVPMLTAFFATLLVRRHTKQMRWEYATRFSAALAFSVTAAVIGAALAIGLSLIASGSFGPGRFSFVGIDPLLFGGLIFLEILIPSFLAGLVVIRPFVDADDRK
jgi:hypothetical protein